MGVRLYQVPELDSPIMIAGWPGIGNIGSIAINTLRGQVKAEEFGEIEPWDFFYPRKVTIKDGELMDLEFPASKFYYSRTETRHLVFFVGEEQPGGFGKPYAEGARAYRMANMVLDVALELGCRRIYTSGAAVAAVHHTARPRVWAVPNSERMLEELALYDNAVVMSDIEGRGGQGNITGLNGLLLGVARKRGIDAMCLMGEIPIYLQGFAFPYPRAARSVLEFLSSHLSLKVDLEGINALAARSDDEIERLYKKFPVEIKEQLDKLKYVSHIKQAGPGPITEEDKKNILEEIDRFFKKRLKED
ncbi:MAG: PAC2 family protein [Dehalococcoidia bacterium]|nr:PAC2 family protein [Dehalococcoidia bacterium]